MPELSRCSGLLIFLLPRMAEFPVRTHGCVPMQTLCESLRRGDCQEENGEAWQEASVVGELGEGQSQQRAVRALWVLMLLLFFSWKNSLASGMAGYLLEIWGHGRETPDFTFHPCCPICISNPAYVLLFTLSNVSRDYPGSGVTYHFLSLVCCVFGLRKIIF